MDPLRDFTSFGHEIDGLFRYTTAISLCFFAIIAGALAFFLIRYRARPGHRAAYATGADRRSLIGRTLLVILVFMTSDGVLRESSARFAAQVLWKYPNGPEVVKVMVMPQQWAWNFRYAGRDGAFNTPDDIVTLNEMRVPRGRPVLVQLKSKDVVHGFFIPNARIQADAIPGQVTKLWFDADRTGNFEIACYHLCGTAHYKMKAALEVLEPADYEAWVEENSAWAASQFDPADKSLQWGWAWGL